MMRALLMMVALSVAACGGHTTPDDLSGTRGGAGRVGASGTGASAGTASANTGGVTDGAGGSAAGGATTGSGGQASGLAGLDQVCAPFLARVNGASADPGCAACIDGASKGACAAELTATKSTQGPCTMPNDCANNQCKCDNGACPTTWCSCMHGCFGTAPDECSDAWSAALTCLANVCGKAC